MDNHYPFPPAYLSSTPAVSPIVPSPQFSPSLSLSSSNGHFHYPQPLHHPQHQPGMMYTPHPDMQYSRTNYPPDGSRWHGYSYGNPPSHLPGLPVPPAAPPVPQALNEEITAASSFADILQLDEYWKGRLAPLPGYQSRPGLIPMRETKPIQIGVPIEKETSRPLPPQSPHSLFRNEHHIKAPSTLTNNNLNTEVSSSVRSS